jgi:hypothetical protein
MSKIHNSIWIKNTNKTGQETMNLLKLLKEIGVLKPSVSSAMNKDSHLIKDKRNGKRSKIDKRKVVAADAIGNGRGGGAGGGGGGGGDGVIVTSPNVSNIDNALSILKSGISSTAYKEQQLKQLKDDTELAIGKLRDAQQDLTRTQQRPNFGFRTSAPRIETFDDITGKYIDINDPFPPKESVVSEPAQEFNREGASVNIPNQVMEQDVTAKVSPEQGQFEDIEEEEEIIPVVKPKPKPEPKPKPKRISYEDIQNYVLDQYDLRPLLENPKKQDLIDFYDNLVNTFGVDNQFEGMASQQIRVPILRQEIVDTIRQQYKILQG